jgi:hypothetical protein
MKALNRIILSVTLSVTCGAAAAEWSQINRDANGTTYVDKANMTAKDGLVTLWSLYDAEVPTEVRPNEYSHSAKMQSEFNCQEHIARTIVMISYGERMASGKVMSVKSIPTEWELINPATWRHALFMIACPKKKS